MENRSIKFRVWDKINKKMREWELVAPAFENMLKMESAFVFMQFTNLKDKNGKEIYEGDILRVDGQFIPERMKIGSGLDFHRDILKVYESDMGWMVIGNIYENPELLTK